MTASAPPAPLRSTALTVTVTHADGRRETIAKPAHAAASFAKAFNRAAAARGSDARATVEIR